jgi:hypothetical protein
MQPSLKGMWNSVSLGFWNATRRHRGGWNKAQRRQAQLLILAANRATATVSALRQLSLGEGRSSSTSELSAIENHAHTVQLYSCDSRINISADKLLLTAASIRKHASTLGTWPFKYGSQHTLIPGQCFYRGCATNAIGQRG